MSNKEKNIFNILYEDLKNGIDLSHLLYSNNKIKLDMEEDDNSVPVGGFIDKTISDYISNTKKSVFKYTVDLLGRKIIIKFYVFNNKPQSQVNKYLTLSAFRSNCFCASSQDELIALLLPLVRMLPCPCLA